MGTIVEMSISLGAYLCFIIELNSIERYMLSLGVALMKLSDSQSVRPSLFLFFKCENMIQIILEEEQGANKIIIQ